MPCGWALESLAGSTRYMPVSLSGEDLKRVNQVTYASGYVGHSRGAGSGKPSRLTVLGKQNIILSLATLQPNLTSV